MCLVTMNIATGAMEFLASREWGVEAARLSDDGRLLAWRTNEDGYSHLRIQGSGRQQGDCRFHRFPGLLSETCWTPDGRRYAVELKHSQSEFGRLAPGPAEWAKPSGLRIAPPPGTDPSPLSSRSLCTFPASTVWWYRRSLSSTRSAKALCQ